MFGDLFSHYLSYGATDQQTVRDLAGTYSGLLIPGTVAAFQREGTGGFVLSLSAASAATAYTIDPRFPLFQQRLLNPKKSHTALAEILGWPSLVQDEDPSPDDFTPELIAAIANNWAEFNGSYQTLSGGKFEKYARRLGEPVSPANAQGPTFVLAPYLMADSIRDPWWRVSCDLYAATLEHVGSSERCKQVVAAKSVHGLGDLLSSALSERVAVWVSSLDELTRPGDELALYGQAISEASENGTAVFALYGGFFSVLLQNLGLSGSSHGIGYGENRNWVELSETGPPPPRYYLPQLHRYVQPDEATRLFLADPRLAECGCDECGGEPPIALEYHSLMKHSVRCRAQEIESWASMTVAEMRQRLSNEAAEYRGVLHASNLAELVVGRVERQMNHLGQWERALAML